MRVIENTDKVPYISLVNLDDSVWISREDGKIKIEPITLSGPDMLELMKHHAATSRGLAKLFERGGGPILEVSGKVVRFYAGKKATEEDFDEILKDIESIENNAIPFRIRDGIDYTGFIYFGNGEWEVSTLKLSEESDFDWNKGFAITGEAIPGDPPYRAYRLNLKYDGKTIFSEEIDKNTRYESIQGEPKELMTRATISEFIGSLQEGQIPVVINSLSLDGNARIAKANIANGELEDIRVVSDSFLDTLYQARDVVEVMVEKNNFGQYTVEVINIVDGYFKYGACYEGTDAEALIRDNLLNFSVDFVNLSLSFDQSGKSIYGNDRDKDFAEFCKTVKESVKGLEI